MRLSFSIRLRGFFKLNKLLKIFFRLYYTVPSASFSLQQQNRRHENDTKRASRLIPDANWWFFRSALVKCIVTWDLESHECYMILFSHFIIASSFRRIEFSSEKGRHIVSLGDNKKFKLNQPVGLFYGFTTLRNLEKLLGELWQYFFFGAELENLVERN